MRSGVLQGWAEFGWARFGKVRLCEAWFCDVRLPPKICFGGILYNMCMEAKMSLYETYRPKSLKMMVGNDDLKRDLLPFVRGKRKPPKAILFTGGSGMGKTTLARILARGIGCAEGDIEELDTADFRGIDSIRDIRRQMMLSSLGGQNRCWILDECFAPGTMIFTSDGDRPIETIQVGDPVFSSVGCDKVTNVFRNKIPLHRVCRVIYSHNNELQSIYCSQEHLFWTQRGWIPAFDLQEDDLFMLASGEMINGNVSVIPYSPDCNWPCIGDKEKLQGYVEFCDLEMKKFPSYYANGILVHNCHKLTNDAQNALLKALENPPEHVYFILCTTDPQLLLKTIITRCTQFVVEALSIGELVQVLQRVCDGEGAKVDEDILRQVAKTAQGSPRAAISALERLLARDPKDYGEILQTFTGYEAQIKDLCQMLIAGKAKWKDVAGIIKGIREEPETVRRSVLGYMNAVLLSGKDSARAAYIMECFKEPYFNTGPAGLTLSCYAGLMQE